MPGTRTPRLVGDHAKRVTVPLPQNLNDLESIARKKFGGGGDNRMMMFHWGETELKNQMQYRRVVDDDVVIIHKEKTDTDGHSYPAHLATTHMAAFVKHPLQPRKPPEAPPRSNYGMAPAKFTGRSCYAQDYLELPVSAPEKLKHVAPAWEPNNIPMSSRSAYADDYPWHQPQPRRKQSGSRRQAAPGHSHAPPVFQGTSSYRIDYIKHAQRPKSATGPTRTKAKADSGPNVPFDASTTYTNDYKKHEGKSPTKGAFSPAKHEPGPSPPFQGSSEYQKEYIKKERPRVALVHLEPERTSTGRTSPTL